MVRKAVTRNLAAPIGISVTVSIGASDRTGLGCKAPIRPRPFSVQWGIFRALTRSSMGTDPGVNGT
jgi:hypothetical protein